MTGQTTEIAVLDGRAYPLLTTPLDDLFDRIDWQPSFLCRSTGNYRGYVARWEVLGNRLFLTGIVGRWWDVPPHLAGRLPPEADSASGKGRTLRLADLFPREAPLVPATWVTGVLTVATEGVLAHGHGGLSSLYGAYRLVNVLNGHVRQIRNFSARQWADRVGVRLPDDWFEGQPDDLVNPPPPGPDEWRDMPPPLRAYIEARMEEQALACPCDASPDPRQPWPEWRAQRREIQAWLKHGRFKARNAPAASTSPRGKRRGRAAA